MFLMLPVSHVPAPALELVFGPVLVPLKALGHVPVPGSAAVPCPTLGYVPGLCAIFFPSTVLALFSVLVPGICGGRVRLSRACLKQTIQW